MFPRYELDVHYKANSIFKGTFCSINRVVKTAACFDDDCVFFLYDSLCDSTLTHANVCKLIKEFKYGEIYL